MPANRSAPTDSLMPILFYENGADAIDWLRRILEATSAIWGRGVVR
jgi:hypothetical protein